MSDKDNWDKADIVAKFLVPIVVALSVLIWNYQKSNQNAAASMVQIAIGILTTPVEDKNIENPLRDWAISTMQNPSSPPTLSDDAASQLRLHRLVYTWNFPTAAGHGTTPTTPGSGETPTTPGTGTIQ